MASQGGREKITAPYGSWKSPITADVVSSGGKQLDGMAIDGEGRLIFVETRPAEGGRAVLVKEPEEPGGKPLDVIPKEFTVRSLVQEYGGGAFAVSDNMVIFSNHKDQRLYKQFIGDYHESSLNPVTTIVSVDLQTTDIQEPKLLVGGNNFYAFPRIDLDGRRMAWIGWGNPNIHWDKAELWVGYISENGDVKKRICVAGGDHSVIESPTEP